MKTFTFTMEGKVYAETEEEAEELLHSVCDGVIVGPVTMKEEHDDAPIAKKPKASSKPVRKGA